MVLTEQQAAQLSPFFAGEKGARRFRAFCRLTALDKVNTLHQTVMQDWGIPPGPDFAKGILDYAGVDFLVGNPQRLAFPEGPFITISNHVYGHLDGIALVDIVGHVRPEMKVMVNEVLMYIGGLRPHFISVNPNLGKGSGATSTSVNGIKSALMQLRNGEPLSLFPAGAVADLKLFGQPKIQEREWQDAAVKLIRKARVPVVPIRFFDHNSWFYYALGLVDYRVRLLRLCHEVFNKRGTHPRLGIGPVISVEEQAAVPEADFKAFLRRSVYDMPLPQEFVPRSQLFK